MALHAMADGLANQAAAMAQLPAEVIEQVQEVDALAARVQRRLIAVGAETVGEKQEREARPVRAQRPTREETKLRRRQETHEVVDRSQHG